MNYRASWFELTFHLLVVVFLTLTMLATASAAVWRLQTPGIKVEDLALTSNAGFVAVGLTDAVADTSEDACVFKLNADGEVLWQRAFGGVEYDEARKICPNQTGGHIVAGETASFAINDTWRERKILVVEIDAAGHLVWQKTYGTNLASEDERPDGVRDMIATDDGGYLLVGFVGTDDLGDHGLVLKLTATGTIQWQQQMMLSNGENSQLQRVIQAADGGYLVAGDNGDPFIAKLSVNGGLEWSRYFDDPDERTYYWADWVQTVIQTRDGGYLLGLGTDRGEYTEDIALLKLSPTGLIEWQYRYGTVGGYNTGGKEYLADIIEQDDGYLLGLSYRAPWASSVIMKISLSGDILFQKRPSGGKYVERFLQTPDQGYALGGTYIQKLDQDFSYGRIEEGGCDVYTSDVRRHLSEFFIDESIQLSAQSSSVQPETVSMSITDLALEIPRSCYVPNLEALRVIRDGNGLVTSTPAGISCGDLCSSGFAPGTLVQLQAIPAFGQRFAGWSGACSGVAPICEVEIAGSTRVDADFTETAARRSTWKLQYHDIYRDSDETVNDMVTTLDGGFVAVGSTTAFNDRDAFVFRINQDGEMLWQRAVGEGADETAYRVQHTPAGTYVVAGETFSFGAAENENDSDRKEIFLLEIDGNGEVLWQKTYGTIFPDNERPDEISDLILTDDAGYLIAGMSTTADGERLAFAMKLSRTGLVQWQQRFRLSSEDANSLSRGIQTSDGGYALVGGLLGAADPFLIKLSNNGLLEWSRYYDDPHEGTYQNSDWPTSLIQTEDGGYLLGLSAEIDEWDYMHDAALLKLSPTGLIEWQYLYGVTGHQNWARDWTVDLLEQENSFVVGMVYAQNYRGGAVLDIDKASGAIRKQQHPSGTGNPSRFLATADGGYAFAGDYLTKLNANFGYDCRSGEDEGCTCQTYDSELERRIAEYFIDDEIQISAENAGLQAQTRDMDVSSLELESWRDCFASRSSGSNLLNLLPSWGGWRAVLFNHQ
ncbi:MAG: hypothetical protein C1943_07530 [Halochromatium sp.]|nr:hypothetical protein [Halochromatium sp.]